MRRWIDRLYVLAFCLILAGPLLQMTFHIARIKKLDEERALRSVADPLRRWAAMDPTLPADVNGWFDDHYGMRDLMIRTSNEIGYRLFRTSDKVYVGRDGWLFDKSFVRQIWRDAERPDNVARIMDAVRDLRDCLASRGVALAVIVEPSKGTVYPEFLPAAAERGMPSRLAQRLAEQLRREPGLTFVDAERLLAGHKDEPLYYKTDIHMTWQGARFVYGDLVARIAAASNLPVPHIDAPAGPSTYFRGGESRFMSKLLPLGETVLRAPTSVERLPSDPLTRWQADVGAGAIPGYPDLPVFDWVVESPTPDPALLPPTVIFGTSFTDNLFTLRLHQAFRRVYRTKSTLPARIGPLIRNLPSDAKFFVLEYPEPFADQMQLLAVGPHCETGAP